MIPDYMIPDIRGIRVYKNGGIEVIRGEYRRSLDRKWYEDMGGEDYIRGESKEIKGITRGKVRELSSRSRSRMAWVISQTDVNFSYMSTLTYGANYPVKNKEVNKDRNVILSSIKRQFDRISKRDGVDRNSMGYFWFLEFQKRGCTHLHILLSHKLDEGKLMNCWLSINEKYGNELSKVEYVHLRKNKRGDSFIMEKEIKTGGLKRYAIKYSLKMEQKTPPRWWEGGRFYGYSRNVTPACSEAYVDMSEEELRVLLKEHRCSSYDVLPRYIIGAI